MHFLKRAFLAVSRRKGKSLIMFVIFAAIANMVLAGLAIQHATDYASVLARQKLGGQLTLRFNWQKAFQDARNTAGGQRPMVQRAPVTDDMVKMIAKQKNIINYNEIVNANGSAQGFKAVSDTESQQSSPMGGYGFGGGFFGGNMVIPDVSVTGILSTKLTDAFSNGDAKLLSGKEITSDDAGKKVAMVEKTLADQDNLKIGSKIKVKATRNDNAVEYSIIGIYQDTSSSSSSSEGMGNMSFTQPYNKIYVDYKSAIPLKTFMTDAVTNTSGVDQAVFFVDDPKNIDQVKADAKAMKIDWSKYVLDANDRAYQQMTGPIENVASFSMTVVYMVAIAGAVILTLILMLSVKERTYETGVLLSMGEGKTKIIGQYVAEALIIAVIAFGLSIFTGKYIAQDVGNTLLHREIKVVQQQANSNGGGGNPWAAMFGRRQQNYQPIDSFNIQITNSEVGKMSVAGLLILLAGTIVPAATIMAYKPKTILTKAS